MKNVKIGDILLSVHNDMCYAKITKLYKGEIIAEVYYRAEFKYREGFLNGMTSRSSWCINYYDKNVIKVGPIWEYLYG